MKCEKKSFLWKINLAYWKDITGERDFQDYIEMGGWGICNLLGENDKV